MTADIKLLPLPDMTDGDAFVVSDEGDEVWIDFYGENSIQDYARANMAPLIVEIERLRAEVKSLQTLRDVVIENHGYWKDRAERLTEALRKVDEQLDDVECECPAGIRAISRCHFTIFTALRDHDQEGNSG